MCFSKRISRRLGIGRETVARYFQYDEYPRRIPSPSRASKVIPFNDYLSRRWEQGERNYNQLFREIKEKGFDGSLMTLYRYLVKNYPFDSESGKRFPPLELKIYSARRLSYLLGREKETLQEKEVDYLDCLFRHCPEAKCADQLVRQFRKTLINREAELLDQWIEDAVKSGPKILKNFAEKLKQDYEAVKNACSQQWSNGQVEGQVNRLKNIKRQMYGRASFRLLRKMVLGGTG